VSGSGEGSDDRPPAYPVTSKNSQMVDRNNSVWISPADKPVVMRLPKDSLRNVQNQASPAISETYNINPFRWQGWWIVKEISGLETPRVYIDSSPPR
jgi:hypothetical protein